MSTRSTYRVIEKGEYGSKKWANKLVLLYIQMDGYPSGHPSEIAEWLASGTVVNGLGINQKEQLLFNGAGCLAAQLVEKMKDGPGGAYILPIQHRGKCDEEYVYDIIVDSNTQTIEFIAYYVTSGGYDNKPPRFKKLYSGAPAGFAEWVGNVYSKQE